jgi:hypothetical protein
MVGCRFVARELTKANAPGGGLEFGDDQDEGVN